MSEQQTADDGRLSFGQVAVKIVEALRGRNLLEGEAMIEVARRILWMQHFTGSPAATVMGFLNAPSDARYAAAAIAEASAGSLLTAEELLLEVRFALYVSAYGHQSGTRFGDAMQRHLAERRASSPPTLN